MLPVAHEANHDRMALPALLSYIFHQVKSKKSYVKLAFVQKAETMTTTRLQEQKFRLYLQEKYFLTLYNTLSDIISLSLT